MSTRELDTQTKARAEARKILDEAWERAHQRFSPLDNMALKK